MVSWLLQQLFRPLGLTEVNDLQSVVKLASPGQDPYLQGYLARVPMPRPTGPSKVVKEEVLTRKLINFVSVKGEDLLVQAPTEHLVKFQRLRTSVPSRLWRWRTVFGWAWQHSGFHINVLEL